MKIEIAQRLAPFCHTKGIHCLIPGIDWKIQAYPTRWYFQNIENNDSFFIDFSLDGPFKNFTCMQDLEKGKVTVFGQAKQGYFRIDVQGHTSGIDLICAKGPAKGICYTLSKHGKKEIFYPKDRISIDLVMTKITTFSSGFERLSLGSHKKQDWDLMLRRNDLKELVPIWMKLGTSKNTVDYPIFHPILEKCKKLITNNDTVHIEDAFLQFFQASFEGMMCPVLEDNNFLGLMKPSTFFFSPILLLQKGAHLLRTLFFEQKDDHLYILPCLPKSFVSGRFIQIYLEEIGTLHFEWSKHMLRKMILQASSNKQIHLHLQKQIKKFRLKTKKDTKGIIVESKQPLHVKAGYTYFLDRFQK